MEAFALALFFAVCALVAAIVIGAVMAAGGNDSE